MAAVTARRWLLLAALCLPAGCREDGTGAPADAWPLTLSEPGVLGYAAVQLAPDLRDGIFRELVSWSPDGLAADRPVVFLRLDGKTFGGPFALLLPVADRGAFEASLPRAESLHALGQGRYRLDAPPESPLRLLLLLGSESSITSPFALLQAFASSDQVSLEVEIDHFADHALLVPSFEARGLCKRVLESAAGFAAAPAHALVVSLDLDRLRIVYAEQIRAAEDQLRSVLSGVRAGGALSMMGAMAGGHAREAGMPGLDVNWELLWALKDMLALGNVDALQVAMDLDLGSLQEAGDGRSVLDVLRDRGRNVDSESSGEDEDIAYEATDDLRSALQAVTGVHVRLRLDPESPVRPLLAAAAPVPAGDAAALTLAARPDAFAGALAAWCRPIAEVVKGRGPPADRYLDELARLLGAWDGLLRVEAEPGEGEGLADRDLLLLAGVADGRELDTGALRAWLDPLLATARIEGWQGGWSEDVQADGRHILRDAEGAAVLTLGVTDAVGWAMPGDPAGPPADALARFRQDQHARAAALAQGPDGAQPTVTARLVTDDFGADVAVRDDELQLHVQRATRER